MHAYELRDMYRVVVGKNIAHLRKSKGLTQAQLADIMGMHPKTLHQMERGKYLMGMQRALDFCDAFQITIPELFTPIYISEEEEKK